jgi:hypothetical protein
MTPIVGGLHHEYRLVRSPHDSCRGQLVRTICADHSWSSCSSVHSPIAPHHARRSGGAIRTQSFRVEDDAVDVEDDGLAKTPDHDNQPPDSARLKPRAPFGSRDHLITTSPGSGGTLGGGNR